MASIVQIPFDNNPSSTTLKTSSYTIPAGKYAYVQPQFYDFTLNGVDVVTGPEQLAGTFSTGANSTSISFTGVVPINKNLKLRWTSNATNGVVIGVATPGQVGMTSYSATLSSSGTAYLFESIIYTSVSSSGNIFFNANNASANISLIFIRHLDGVNRNLFAYASPVLLTNFWVPSGTVLNGSRYMVTEYNAIS
jgi:hypothetical protein